MITKALNISGGFTRSRLVPLALSCALWLAPSIAYSQDGVTPLEIERNYDFSRWQVQASPGAVAGLVGDADFSINNSSIEASTRPASSSFEVNLSDFWNTDLPRPSQENAGMVSSDSTINLDLGQAGFFGGIDTGTALFYSASAVIGLVGANLKEDVNKPFSSVANTSYLQDPSNFQTEEFNNQYGLQNINAHYAYARGHEGEGVLVSVMDTPFNTSHANLEGVFVTGYNPANGTSDVALDCANASNPCRHGTHVAGIIAARKTNSSTSMHGVAFNAKVKPVAFLGSGITLGSQQVEAFAQASGIDNSTGKQIVAMNNSWGPIAGFHDQTYQGKYFKVPQQTLISAESSIYIGSKAAAEADTIMVFAAGNDGWNSSKGEVYLYDSLSSSVPSAKALASSIIADAGVTLTSANRVDTTTATPTHAPDTDAFVIDEDENEHMWLVVVATDENNDITAFSNGCAETKNYCLAAPGGDINSTNGSNNTPYVELDGTSMAAPHVTGAIAVLAEMYPNLLDKPENISQILLETATDLGVTGIDEVYGHGLLNLQKATGPLGTIDITDGSFGGSGNTYNGNADLQTPIAFGDALSQQQVLIGGVDKYQRVFMVDVPVQHLDMAASGMAAKGHEHIRPANNEAMAESHYLAFQEGLAFQGDNDGSDNIINAGLQYGATSGSGKMLASLKMNMDVAKPSAGIDGDVGYTRYFNAMAYAGQTAERMDINMRGHVDGKGTMVASDIRLDRDADENFTFTSSSSATSLFGPLKTLVTLGGITEEGRMLGGEMTGPLAVKSTHTIFAKAKLSYQLNRFSQLNGYYEYGRSVPSFVHSGLVSASAISSDTYGVSFNATPRLGEEIFLTLRRPVAITGGNISFNTITGYDADGEYQRGVLSYGVAPKDRETELLAEYRRQFFPGNMVALGINRQHNAYNISGLKNTGGYLRSEWLF